jgi:hypothetical protein
MLPRTLADDVVLRHGYTLAQVKSITLGLAKRQTWHKSTTVVSFDQRLEVAWHAVIEHLYASDQPPTPGEMMRAADRAVNRDVQLAHQFHGHKTHDRYAKTTTKGFELYWWHTASTAPSPENKVTERVALAQIWPRLRPEYQQVLAALAAHGDHGLAAASLVISRRLFTARLSEARQAFLRRWHEGESPSRVWTTGKSCAVPKLHAGSDLLLYARRLCSSVSSTCSWSECSVGWCCWRAATPPRTLRSWSSGTRSRCCDDRSPAQGWTGLTAPC